MLWLNFIHLYQPANLEKEKIELATLLSYERILRTLEENQNFKMTANIAGSLLIRWADDLGRQDLIDRFKKIIKRGQLEIVGSAAYHALLPLVTKEEAINQIQEQEKLLKKYLNLNQPKGFFLSEMAYSPEIAKIIKKLGYEWIIVDEITVFGELNKWTKSVYIDSNSGLKVLARNRSVSESYVPDTLNELIKKQIDEVMITGTDAELYGLRHLDETAEFEKLSKNNVILTDILSSYIAKQQSLIKVKLQSSNWQTTKQEMKKDISFALWSDQKSQLHQDLWSLAQLAQELLYKNRRNKNFYWSRWHLWRGLQSCTWWWASNYDFRSVFGPIAWSPDEVERGVNEIIRSIRSLESATDLKTKVMAEKLALKIRTKVWLKHWQKK